MSTEPTIVALKGVRGMTADHMVKSLATAAQLTHHASADLSPLLNEKNRLAKAGHKVSVEDLLIVAAIRALKLHPHANGRVVEREIHHFDAIDLSIAISLPGSLLVAPALSGVDKMNVLELNEARRDLIERAKSNTVSVTEMTGGTFTVSNLGLTRVEHFTPIINLPQICILGFGCTVDRPVYGAKGDIELHPFIGLSLTFDHRALDGEPAGQFLTSICEEIESIGDVPLVTAT